MVAQATMSKFNSPLFVSKVKTIQAGESKQTNTEQHHEWISCLLVCKTQKSVIRNIMAIFFAFPDVDSCSCFETGFQCRTTDCRSIAHFLKLRCVPHRFVEIQTEIYMKLY